MKIYHNINEIDFNVNRVISIGGFDGIHLGHQKIFEIQIREAVKHNIKQLVITFDPLPKIFFNKNNNKSILISTKEKIKVLKKMKIDELFVIKFDEEFSDLSALDFIELLINKIGFKIYIVGENHTFGKNCEGNLTLLKTFSKRSNIPFEVCGVKSITKNGNVVSSTLIKKLILDGNIDNANKLLGHHYFIIGKVIGGDRIGNKLGFPTANIKVSDNKIIPKNGVYLVQVYLQDKKYFGTANIGFRPTIKDLSNICIEVHILDFKDDVYGAELEIKFLQYIRAEKKFNNVNELAVQIKKDIDLCRKITDGIS